MTILDYFAKPDARRILLLDVQRTDANATCYRLSDGPYATDSADTPANVAYSPIVGGNGLPELRRTLNEVWDRGNASTGFGQITLVNPSANYTSTPGHGSGTITLPRGTAVTARIAAPHDYFPLADAITLAVGKVNRLGGSSDGSLTFEIVDGTSVIAAANIAVDPAVAPICWGYCRNVTPFLTNPATLKYTVHDGAVNDITAVYDDGVLLTAGVGYTKVNASGYFTLTSSPVGKITADVQGASVSGTWLQSTAQVMGNVLDRAGITSYTRSFGTLPTGLVGLYITQTTTVGALLDRLVQGCAGYWLVDRTGTLLAAQYPLPAAGTAYTEASLLSEVTWTDSDRLYSKINYSYRPNYTTYQARVAASTAQATFAAGQGLTGAVTITPVAEYTYAESPVLATLFDGNADASAVATRMSTLYSVPRKIMQAVVPYSNTLALGDAITISFFGASYNGAVISIADVFDGQYPTQKITVMS